MATTITLKKSSTEGKKPDAGDLAIAELAVNLADKKLYTKNAAGEVIELSGGVNSGGSGDKPTDPSPGDLYYDEDTKSLYFWNGTTWEQIISEDGGGGDVELALGELKDVDTTTDAPEAGDFLKWDGTNWVPAAPAEQVEALGELTDVDLASTPPEAGNVLTYDADSNLWIPGVGGGGGGGTAVDKPPMSMPGTSLITADTTVVSANGLILSKKSDADEGAWTDNGTYQAGDVIAFKWKDDAFDSAASGETVSETVTMTSYQVNVVEYTFTVDKVPDDIALGDPMTDVAVGGVVENPNINTIEGINTRAFVWGSTTAVSAEVSIGGEAYVALPAAPGSLTIEPGKTFQVRHTTPNTALAECQTTLVIGFSADVGQFKSAVWQTTNMDAGVATPTWTNPTEGEIDVALNVTFIASAFSSFGGAGNHLNTDWQIASDADFTSIVEESMADASNKTSWTPTNLLPSNTALWARVRYRADGASSLESAWAEVSFTSIDMLPPLVNGSTGKTSGTWTVPDRIGTVRFEAEGGGCQNTTGGKGGRVCATYTVSAGDVFRIDGIPQGSGTRAGNAYMIGPDGGSTLDQGTLWVAVGGEGSPKNSGFGSYGQDGGGDSGGKANNPDDGGTRDGGGGSQNSGGAGGNKNNNRPPGEEDKKGKPGSALRGGDKAPNNTGENGAGAGGWFGGGGADNDGGFGGGGSGRVQGPSPTDTSNQRGASTGGGGIQIIW